MDVVNAVEVNIFKMPSESGLPHAKVYIGGVDTRDFLAENIQKIWQIGNIP